MRLTADYHTHTVFSHGKGSIYDNVKAAADANLKEIGITDHGFAHPAFGLKKGKIPVMRELCAAAEKEFGVKTYLGIESNIIGIDGTTDFSSYYQENIGTARAEMDNYISQLEDIGD